MNNIIIQYHINDEKKDKKEENTKEVKSAIKQKKIFCNNTGKVINSKLSDI